MSVSREHLRGLLDAHRATDPEEEGDLATMRRHLVALAEPFSREQPGAHFTGSAIVVDPRGDRVCLVHHRKLERWLQPGGHADPGDEGRMERTALREAWEESGLEVRLHPAAPGAIDVDVHAIPARKGEPAHDHLDVRFLLRADDPERLSPDPNETRAARWVRWDEALELTDESALSRLLRKARTLATSRAPNSGGSKGS